MHVTDDRVRGAIPCTPSTLATGETATCTAEYTISQADVDAGHVTNTAHANGRTPNDDDVTSPPAVATVTATRTPGIHLLKSAFPTEYAEAGETIHYAYTVANIGNVTLHHVTLTDNRLGPITCPRHDARPRRLHNLRGDPRHHRRRCGRGPHHQHRDRGRASAHRAAR